MRYQQIIEDGLRLLRTCVPSMLPPSHRLYCTATDTPKPQFPCLQSDMKIKHATGSYENEVTINTLQCMCSLGTQFHKMALVNQFCVHRVASELSRPLHLRSLTFEWT